MNSGQLLEKTCSDALLELLTVTGDTYVVSGETLTPQEIAEADGLLPIFVHIADSAWVDEFKLPRCTALRKSVDSLVDVKTEFLQDGGMSLAWFTHVVAGYLRELGEHADNAKQVSLDETYKNWHAAVSRGLYEVHPEREGRLI